MISLSFEDSNISKVAEAHRVNWMELWKQQNAAPVVKVKLKITTTRVDTGSVGGLSETSETADV